MSPSHFYEFLGFRLDPEQRLLFHNGEVVPLAPKAFDTLLLLVENHGRILEKETLLKRVWPDTFVEEGSLSRNISVLRKVLEDGQPGAESIENIPKRGYRFTAIVLESLGTDPGADRPLATPVLDPPPPLAPRIPVTRGPLFWVATALVTAAMAGAILFWLRRPVRSAESRGRNMIVVLPYSNLTGDPAQEYVCDGLTEETITQLGRLNPDRLGVIARTSSMAYKGTRKTVDQIGGELGVDYLLEGSVRGNAGQMRFTVQLIRVRDQTHVWAHEYDRAATDILSMQSDISRVVADEVDFALVPRQKPYAAESSLRSEVYDLYLQGRFHWNKRSRDGLAKGVDYFRQAIAKDPNYAPAYAGLADCLFLQNWISDVPREQAIPQAKAAARRAIELDPSLGEPHASLGIIAVYERHWPEAETEFNRALALNSNYPTAHHWNGIRLAAIGRPADGVAEVRRAIALDPLSPILHTELGWLLVLSRSPEPAIHELYKSLELDSGFYLAHMYIARAYELERQYPQAISEMSKAVELSAGKPELKARLGRIYGLAGQTEEARHILAQLERESKPKPIPPLFAALIYSGLGEKEMELTMFEKADAEGTNIEASWIKVDPTYDSIRTEPRFQRILERNGLQ